MQTGIVTAMVDYPIGHLIAERVRAMGVKLFYKRFKHNGANGPNMLWNAGRSAVIADISKAPRAAVE
jgi:hypothetical protein